MPDVSGGQETRTEQAKAADALSIQEIERAVDAQIDRDSRNQWAKEAAGIAATVAGLAAVGSAVAAAPEVLAAAALATGAGAAIGSAGAAIGRIAGRPPKRGREARLLRRFRARETALDEAPDPLATLAPSRLATREYLTAASKDPSLVSQEPITT